MWGKMILLSIEQQSRQISFLILVNGNCKAPTVQRITAKNVKKKAWQQQKNQEQSKKAQ